MSGERHHLRFIPVGRYDGFLNMAVDEELLRNHVETRDGDVTLRFYRFTEPTLTIGYGIWKTFDRQSAGNLPFIRRITGGGIVSHGSDLTYALILSTHQFPFFKKVKESYRKLHELLSETLKSFGVETSLWAVDCRNNGPVRRFPRKQEGSYCFENPVLHDVMCGSLKISGAAQKRTQGYLLHQGSIAWDRLDNITPGLSEAVFIERLSNRLAKWLQIQVKPSMLSAEELKAVPVVA